MNTIWKFVLNICDYQEVEMPLGAYILSAGQDGNGDLCVWALVNNDFKTVRRFRILGTGNMFPDYNQDDYHAFLGTVVMNNGLVWHIWESHRRGYE